MELYRGGGVIEMWDRYERVGSKNNHTHVWNLQGTDITLKMHQENFSKQVNKILFSKVFAESLPLPRCKVILKIKSANTQHPSSLIKFGANWEIRKGKRDWSATFITSKGWILGCKFYMQTNCQNYYTEELALTEPRTLEWHPNYWMPIMWQVLLYPWDIALKELIVCLQGN